jgi:hypothetical protein
MPDIVTIGDESAFATTTDVEARMGVEFTTEQTAQCEALLVLIAQTVAAELDRDDDWLDDETTIPTAFRTASIEAVVRVMHNPGGVRSRSEQLGAYQISESFPADTSATAGLSITEQEALMVRRAWFGANTGGANAQTVVDDVYDPDVYDPLP